MFGLVTDQLDRCLIATLIVLVLLILLQRADEGLYGLITGVIMDMDRFCAHQFQLLHGGHLGIARFRMCMLLQSADRFFQRNGRENQSVGRAEHHDRRQARHDLLPPFLPPVGPAVFSCLLRYITLHAGLHLRHLIFYNLVTIFYTTMSNIFILESFHL